MLRPVASSFDHPVNDWAIEFMKTTWPCWSVVITASPMLFSVMLSCLLAFLAARSASQRAIERELTKVAPIINADSRNKSSAPIAWPERMLQVIADNSAHNNAGGKPAYVETRTTATRKSGARPIQGINVYA